MARSKTTRTAEIDVRLLREGILEAHHSVQAMVCDRRGRVMMLAGEANQSCFARSALKPFQALTVVSLGTLEHFDLSNRDLAIMCSSHQGRIEQARQAFNILWRCDVDPSALQCPVPEGGKSALENNCSGKHAGMLAASRHCNWSLTDYLNYHHPIQEAIAQQVGELLGMPAQELVVARDDCGAPTYFMSLQEMATLFACLASSETLELERVARSMTSYPELISGDGGFDTELMRLTQGELVSKSGAEGLQCIGRVGESLGLVIKATDGAKRAKYAAAIHLLRQLGWIGPDVAESLADRYINFTEFKRLDIVGDLAMV